MQRRVSGVLVQISAILLCRQIRLKTIVCLARLLASRRFVRTRQTDRQTDKSLARAQMHVTGKYTSRGNAIAGKHLASV